MSTNELRAQINKLLVDGMVVETVGTAVMDDMMSGVAMLAASREKLYDAGQKVIKSMEIVDDVTRQLRVILDGSSSLEAMQALTGFELAKEKLEEFLGIIAKRVNLVDRAIQLLQGASDDPSGNAFFAANKHINTAMEQLVIYRDNL